MLTGLVEVYMSTSPTLEPTAQNALVSMLGGPVPKGVGSTVLCVQVVCLQVVLVCKGNVLPLCCPQPLAIGAECEAFLGRGGEEFVEFGACESRDRTGAHGGVGEDLVDVNPASLLGEAEVAAFVMAEEKGEFVGEVFGA